MQELKQLFKERMKNLLDEEDYKTYLEFLKKPTLNFIRCNTLKISPEKLKERLEKNNWKIKQPFKNFPEIMIIENELLPGELGRSLEHLLGFYYVQEIASMLPVLALEPKENEIVLDLCAAPGSKTTQIAAKMKNTGTIIANEVSISRLKILASNTERCGLTNLIITKKEGAALCRRMKKANILFDKILLDAPCSGEGTLRSSPRTYSMWNINTVKIMSGIQKELFESAFEILKPNGILVYSTCTHAPEENEEIVDFALETFKNQIQIEKISLPIKTRPGIKKWQDKEYLKEVQLACRVYPQDNNTEGFFIAKFRRVK